MGKRRVLVLALVLSASTGCNNEYPLAPTPCDDYCLATQRADCEEDWPADCVRQCEFTRSPARYPNCTAEFETLLACYEALDDDDFQCVAHYSEPLPGLCKNETRSVEFCISPFFYRCLALCEDRSERCATVELRSCMIACQSVPEECEDTAVPYLDCELADTSACAASPNCTELNVAISNCIVSLGTPS